MAWIVGIGLFITILELSDIYGQLKELNNWMSILNGKKK